MTNVFIIGNDCDQCHYLIQGVFQTKEKAEEIIQKLMKKDGMHRDHYNILKAELDKVEFLC